MADQRQPVRPEEAKDPLTGMPRRREIVRKRLSQPQPQPQQATSSSQWEPTDAHRNSEVIRAHCLASSHLPQAPAPSKEPDPSRSLKRKISTTTAPQLPSDRPENRNVNPNKPFAEAPSYSSFNVPPPHPGGVPPTMYPTATYPMYQPPSTSTSTSSSSLGQKKVKGTSTVFKPSALHQVYDGASALSHRHCPVTDHAYTGPLAASEFQRMRKEIDSLKEAYQGMTKTTKRYAKKLEEYKAEIGAMKSVTHAKDLEISAAQEKQKRAEELISTIEMSVNCQICMDLPENPHTLSPCGHVLCLLCLQEWFRKAPPSLDDMDISPEELSDPGYILMRSKSCPTCRATIKRRPAPVFMVKAVASALRKHNNVPSADDGDIETDDPWKGIFLSSDEEEEEEDDDTDYGAFSDEDVHSDFGPALNWYQRQAQLTFGIPPGIGEEDDDDEDDDDYIDEDEDDDDDDEDDDEDATSVQYIAGGEMHFDEEDDEDEDGDDEDEDDDEPTMQAYPRWAPPTVAVDATQYDALTNGEYKLLQRGCTLAMIRAFNVGYHHDLGIVVRFSENLLVPNLPPGPKRLLLGWNVHLEERDRNGMELIMSMPVDIVQHPHRWRVLMSGEEGYDYDLHRMVDAEREDDYYSTSDSDA